MSHHDVVVVGGGNAGLSLAVKFVGLFLTGRRSAGAGPCPAERPSVVRT